MSENLKFNSARMEQRMEELDLTDADLAELTGIGKSTIYYLRKGKHKTTTGENISKIAVALKTTVDWLLGKDVADGRVPVLLPATLRRLADIAGRLSEMRQEELLRIAATLADMEREQPQMPAGTMRLLTDIAVQIEEGIIGEEDWLASLKALLRGIEPPPFVALGPGQGSGEPKQNH